MIRVVPRLMKHLTLDGLCFFHVRTFPPGFIYLYPPWLSVTHFIGLTTILDMMQQITQNPAMLQQMMGQMGAMRGDPAQQNMMQQMMQRPG